MSTKHVRSAIDLARFNAGLEIRCGGCGHAEVFSGMDIAQVFGTAPIASFRGRLKCSKCAAKRVTVSVIDPPPAR